MPDEAASDGTRLRPFSRRCWPPPGALPADESRYAFEPKWDGFRALVAVDGAVRVRSRRGRDLRRYCPELAGLQVDGEVLVNLATIRETGQLSGSSENQ